MKRATPGHARMEEERIAALGNKQLFEQTLELAGGDDYDGCFTPNGNITYSILCGELELRLKDWFEQDIKQDIRNK